MIFQRFCVCLKSRWGVTFAVRNASLNVTEYGTVLNVQSLSDNNIPKSISKNIKSCHLNIAKYNWSQVKTIIALFEDAGLHLLITFVSRQCIIITIKNAITRNLMFLLDSYWEKHNYILHLCETFIEAYQNERKSINRAVSICLVHT